MGNPVGPDQMVWLVNAYINVEMFLFSLQKAGIFKQSLSLSLILPHTITFLHTKHTVTVHTNHCRRHAVHVFRVEVALPIVRLYDPSQAAVQGNVSLSVRGEDQKVGRPGPPTDLLLVPIKGGIQWTKGKDLPHELKNCF